MEKQAMIEYKTEMITNLSKFLVTKWREKKRRNTKISHK